MDRKARKVIQLTEELHWFNYTTKTVHKDWCKATWILPDPRASSRGLSFPPRTKP